MDRTVWLGVLAISLWATAPVAAGPCAVEAFGPVPISNGTVAIAEGGGVIVALEIGGFAPKPGTSAGVEQPGWRFKDVNTLKQPVVRTIAPGLAVYGLPAGGGAVLTLVDDQGRQVTSLKRALAERRELPAPKLSRVRVQTSTTPGPRASSSTVAMATFGDAPADAMLVVLYEVPTKSAPVPLSWGRVAAGDRQTVVYQSGGRCRPAIPGVVAPTAKTNVAIAWVDSSGRVSPLSKRVFVE